MRWRRAIIVVVGLGALALGLTLLFPESLAGDDRALGVTAAVLAIAYLLGVGRFSFGQFWRGAGLWLLIALVIAIGYAFREDARLVGERLLAELLPYRATAKGGAVVIRRSQDRSFIVEAEVEGKAIRFLVDTGASSVALSQSDARRLGLDPDRLTYSVPVQTAAGPSAAAPIRLRRIRVGSIVVEDVRAHVAQRLEGSSLLGMTFLSRLGSYEVVGDTLTLRP